MDKLVIKESMTSMNGLKQVNLKYKKLSIEVKAAIWYTISNIAQKGINMLVVPIYTRLLTASEYGTYSVFISWLEIFEIIATFRLFSGAYIVGLVKFEDDKYRYTSSLEVLSIILTTCFLGVYLIIHKVVDAVTGLSMPLTIMLFVILYTTPVVGFWKAWQRVENKYLQMVGVTLATTFLTPLFGILSILLVRREASIIIEARVIVEVVIAFIIFMLFRELYLSKVRISYCLYGLKTNIPLIPYYLSTTILNHSDRIIIQHIVGYTEAGIYSVAYSVAMMMGLFSSALNTSLQPWLFKCLKADKTEEVAKVTNLSTMFIMVINMAVVFLTPEIIRIFAPGEYYDAIWIVPPVTASVVVMYIYQQFVNVEFYYEEGKLTAIASVGAAVMNVVLNIVFIPMYGYLAAGYTTLASYIVFAFLHYAFMIRICKKYDQRTNLYDIRTMLFSFFAFLFIAAVALSTYKLLMIRYIILIIGLLIGIWKRRKIMIFLKLILDKRS